MKFILFIEIENGRNDSGKWRRSFENFKCQELTREAKEEKKENEKDKGRKKMAYKLQ